MREKKLFLNVLFFFAKNFFLVSIFFVLSSCGGGGGGGGCTSAPNISCGSATTLTVDDPCISGTTCSGNTPTATACNAGMSEGVWYSFVAGSSSFSSAAVQICFAEHREFGLGILQELY